MKTLNFFTLIMMTILMLSGSIWLTGQKIEVENDSDSNNPHILLEESGATDYTRIRMQNTGNIGYWTLATRSSTSDDFNIFYSPTGSGGKNIINIDGTDDEIRLRSDVEMSETLDVDKLATLFDLSVSEQASFGKGLISSDPIRIRESGQGPAGPSLEFMSDNSSSTVGANIKLTNATGGGNNRNLLIENRSVVGDISFILDGSKTHLRLSNGNAYSHVDFQPWISDGTDLGSTGKVWDNFYVNHILSNVAFGEEDINGSSVVQINERSSDTYSLAFKNNGSGNDVWYVKNGVNSLEWWYDANGEDVAPAAVFRGKFEASGGGFASASDARLKKSILPLESTLDKIKKLNPTSYQFNEQKADDIRKIGFIAQEVEKIFPEAVSKPESNEEFYSLNYGAFSVIAIKAIQEQQDIIEAQNVEIAQMKSMYKKVITEMAEIKQMMDKKK